MVENKEIKTEVKKDPSENIQKIQLITKNLENKKPSFEPQSILEDLRASKSKNQYK